MEGFLRMDYGRILNLSKCSNFDLFKLERLFEVFHKIKK